MGTISYLKNFLKDPGVASVTPTSRFTIEKVCRNIDFSKDLRIMEYGPADGVFTRVLLQKMTAGSGIAAIETNDDFVLSLVSIDDRRLSVFHASAEEAGRIAKSLDWQNIDVIISGIPFSFLDQEVKNNILQKSWELLSEDGMFLGYQTSKHLESHLKKFFPSVKTEMEYRNIPPMCIYNASKINGK
ncbi:hypothetical protein QA596_05905 [Balneolales bacterium ANBcel1]|nr:hypothetical protein [Balneolales bacterium ANBcel1]